MNCFRHILVKAHQKKNLLFLLLISFILLVSLFTKVSLGPESSSYFDYLFQIANGKAYFSVVVPINLIALQQLLVEWNAFVLVRSSRTLIVKQNSIVILSLTFVESIICVGTMLALSQIFSCNFVSVNLWQLSALSWGILFLSILTLNLFYYFFSVLINSSSVGLITFVVMLVISSFFSNPALHWLSEIFQFNVENLLNSNYVIGKACLMLGISSGSFFMVTWVYARKEHFGEV